MMKYALFRYVPRRKVHRYDFEQLIMNHMILGFKDGRNVYTRWAACQFARALKHMSLKDTVIVCLPASTKYSHTRRWKLFTQLLCKATGAVDGFRYVTVSGSRKRAHVTGEYELATNIKHYVHIDEDALRGRKVIVVDDIITTGTSSDAFIRALEAAGATVTLAVFLAKTRR